MMIEDMLQEMGCETVGPATSLRQALTIAGSAELDAAVLDINLGDDTSFPAAEVLRGRNVPFLFATGYGSAGLDGSFKGAVVLQKPYVLPEMEAALRQLLGAGCST